MYLVSFLACSSLNEDADWAFRYACPASAVLVSTACCSGAAVYAFTLSRSCRSRTGHVDNPRVGKGIQAKYYQTERVLLDVAGD